MDKETLKKCIALAEQMIENWYNLYCDCNNRQTMASAAYQIRIKALKEYVAILKEQL
tara:strand:+ start:30 stop:200 length:171 start_codon:yes stop_codon:yes gene_type:complete